jgi:serine/threonine protein kinase
MERFRIISKLGAGGFGEAFRAWDREQGVPVVLKRPLPKHLQRPDVLERFDREITRLRELAHPSIVPIVDHGHDAAGLPYLAMRFLPAGSLADRKKPHPISFLHRWLPSVAAALDFVHARGVVHRDVKPANIFFDTESHAYLGDFGIAKVIDADLAEESEHSLTSTGGEIGTYPYMGPEFFQKSRVLSGAYDQYALAVSVYEMICGRRPFSGDSGQLIVAHVTQVPPDVRQFRPEAPTTLCDALTRALSKQPLERFHTCADFAETALQDVSTIAADDSLKRFLCPGCHKLVKVPLGLGGRHGRCTDCGAHLRISEKLDALWLKQEDPSSTDDQPAFRRSLKAHTRNQDSHLSYDNPGTVEDESAHQARRPSDPGLTTAQHHASLQRIVLALDGRLSRQNVIGGSGMLLISGGLFSLLWWIVGYAWWIAALASLAAVLGLAVVLVLVEQITVARAVTEVARECPFTEEGRAALLETLAHVSLPQKTRTLVADAISNLRNN